MVPEWGLIRDCARSDGRSQDREYEECEELRFHTESPGKFRF